MKKIEGKEQRRYVRLNSVFPVEFHLISSQNPTQSLSEIQQGFTRNISKAGICLEVANLRKDLAEALTAKKAFLSLTINIPLLLNPVNATADCVWIKKVTRANVDKYFIGISYRTIDRQEQVRIMRYAKRMHWIPRLVVLLLITLILALGITSSRSVKLQQENIMLFSKLTSILEERSQITSSITNIEAAKKSLEKKIIEASEKNKKQNNISKMKQQLENQLTKLVAEKSSLEKRLIRTEEIKTILEEETIKIMYGWISAHQEEETGLVHSFEGKDTSLTDVAFTYDQSLSAQSFIIFDNLEAVEKMLDFYKYRAKKVFGAFANAYDAVTGDVREYTVHAGPNAWLAIAVLQYTNKTNNLKYLDIAYDVGNWLILLQQEDPEGGIKGGPKHSWFSTEHNIDAYALFKMLYEFSGEIKYKTALDKTMSWLRNAAYNKPEGRFNRGKDDLTVATDTVSFAIAAIGPAKLVQAGIDPEKLIKFAEDNCQVTVSYLRPDGRKVSVTGFDFTNPSHLGREGIISSEWTAQMVIAFRKMADFYKQEGNEERYEIYDQKAKFYWEELGKLAIVKPGESGRKGGGLPYATKGIPYASQGWIDTGHGWMTTKGKDTLSIAGTAYGIFAQRGYNPLM